MCCIYNGVAVISVQLVSMRICATHMNCAGDIILGTYGWFTIKKIVVRQP